MVLVGLYLHWSSLCCGLLVILCSNLTIEYGFKLCSCSNSVGASMDLPGLLVVSVDLEVQSICPQNYIS